MRLAAISDPPLRAAAARWPRGNGSLALARLLRFGGQRPYLAIARAARDFGLDPGQLGPPCALRLRPAPRSVELLADAATAALLEPS